MRPYGTLIFISRACGNSAHLLDGALYATRRNNAHPKVTFYVSPFAITGDIVAASPTYNHPPSIRSDISQSSYQIILCLINSLNPFSWENLDNVFACVCSCHKEALDGRGIRCYNVGWANGFCCDIFACPGWHVCVYCVHHG